MHPRRSNPFPGLQEIASVAGATSQRHALGGEDGHSGSAHMRFNDASLFLNRYNVLRES